MARCRTYLTFPHSTEQANRFCQTVFDTKLSAPIARP
jgi:hypothetical protein